MNRLSRLVPAAALGGLGLALVLASPGRGADEEDKEATARTHRAILELTKVKDDELAGKARSLMKESDLKHVMTAYVPRARGGIGVGPPSGGDGIELKLLKMTRTQMTRGELAKEKADLVQMAKVIRVINEVARHGGPGGAAKQEQWKALTDEMAKASAAFGKALEEGDTKAIKEAAGTLQASCIACHDEFR